MPKNKGFSTIEMMVAVALFAMVMLMSAAAMVTLVNANQKARSVKTAVDNLNFVVETISRSLRVGSHYYCQPTTNSSGIVINHNTQNCPIDLNNSNSGGTYMGFSDRNGKLVFYRYNGSCIQRKVTNVDWVSAAPYVDDLNSGYDCITPADITITRFRFYVYNTGIASPKQPFVTLVISGTVGAKQSTQTNFNLMTSVTQRIPQE